MFKIKVLCLRKNDPQTIITPCYLWMVANGNNMGRWTSLFGVHCLADTFDCKEFLKNKHNDDPNTELIETYVEAPDGIKDSIMVELIED